MARRGSSGCVGGYRRQSRTVGASSSRRIDTLVYAECHTLRRRGRGVCCFGRAVVVVVAFEHLYDVRRRSEKPVEGGHPARGVSAEEEGRLPDAFEECAHLSHRLVRVFGEFAEAQSDLFASLVGELLHDLQAVAQDLVPSRHDLLARTRVESSLLFFTLLYFTFP